MIQSNWSQLLLLACTKDSEIANKDYNCVNVFSQGGEVVSEINRGRTGVVAHESSKAEHYLTRAEELRVLAGAMTSVEARANLLEIAQHYALLAAALLKFGANETS